MQGVITVVMRLVAQSICSEYDTVIGYLYKFCHLFCAVLAISGHFDCLNFLPTLMDNGQNITKVQFIKCLKSNVQLATQQ